MEDWQYQKIMDRLDDMERAQRAANARIRMEIAGFSLGLVFAAGLAWASYKGWFEAWWSWIAFFLVYLGFMAWVGWTADKIDVGEGVIPPR